MNVLVDTPVWSLALRKARRSAEDEATVALLSKLIRAGRVAIIGPVRQEILSGVTSEERFGELRERLSIFKDLPITTEAYELAATFYNQCRRRGIQGSHIDFIICAAAVRNDLDILTLDKDFERYASLIPIRLLPR